MARTHPWRAHPVSPAHRDPWAQGWLRGSCSCWATWRCGPGTVCSHRIAVGSLGDWWHSHLNNRCFGELAQIVLLRAHTGEQQMPRVLQPRCGVALEHGSTPRAVWLCWGTGAGGAPWGHVPHAQVAKFQLCVCHGLCGAGIGVCAPFLTTTKISRKPTHFHCFQSEGPVHILDHECSLSMGLLHAAAQVSHSQLTVHLL